MRILDMETKEHTSWERMMADYGYYHQNRFNLITHFIGVPIIVTSVLVPFTWIHFSGFFLLNAALPVAVVWVLYYISLDRVLGFFSMPFLIAAAAAAACIGSFGVTTGAVIAASGFFGGFALQFIGHAIEGKKPALMAYHPIVAMITSPLFVIAELAVQLGIRKEMFERVERLVQERQAGLAAA